MKICFICDSIFSFGGVQRVLSVIAKGLSEDHSVTILTMDAPVAKDLTMYDLDESNICFEYFNYPELSLLRVFPRKIYSFLYKKILPHNRFTTNLYAFSSYPRIYRRLLLERLNGRNYDVIIGVHAFISLRLGIIRKDLDAPKVIGWMHNSYDAFFHNPNRFLWGLDNQFQQEISKLDDVVVLSQSDRKEYIERKHIKTVVINNPLTLSSKGRGNKNYKTFLAVGRLMPAKGFDLLIDAFALFAKENTEWTLKIVGDGDEKDFLLSKIKEQRMENRIRIYPFTKNIQEYYKQVSVFVLSSRWEGWGLVITEAMAHGLPIVASDLPVVKEILQGYDNNLLFRSESVEEMSSALKKVIRLDLDTMGEISLKMVKKYGLEHILTQWNSLLLGDEM